MLWVMGLILAVIIAGGILLWYAASVETSQVFGPALVRGPQGGNCVALTFDDGPSPATGKILDLLGERQIRATFFFCGMNVERHPEIVRRAAAEGHTLGNHTYSHPFVYLLGRQRFAEEIDRTQDAIERLTGRRPKLFRPPYGARWFGMFSLLRERGLTAVQWSDTGYDWQNDQAAIARATLEKIQPGSIILLHDALEGTESFWAQLRRRVSGSVGEAQPAPSPRADRSATVAALPAILDGAARAGLRFVSVEEFLPLRRPMLGVRED